MAKISRESPRQMKSTGKKAAGRKSMPSAPILMPNITVKGIGKKGQYLGGPTPLVIDPKYGPNPKASIIKGF